MRLVALAALATLVACGHREPATTRPSVANKTSRTNDAAVDAVDIDPRFVQCETYADVAMRAVNCTALARSVRDDIKKTFDDMGPSITERYMDGGDGFTVNAQCDTERAKIEALAAGPCGW